MTHMPLIRDRRRPRARLTSRPGFTLVELLVVMGILVLLAVLTTMAFGRVSRDARLSAGTNAVISALGTARALAMQSNTVVACTFRVVPEAPASNRQVTEIVFAEPTGLTQDFIDDGAPAYKDVFRPIAGITPRRLAHGIQVAGPRTDFSQDLVWITQPNLANSERDRAFAVMFGPDGRLLTRLPNAAVTVQHLVYVDYDGDRVQDVGSTAGSSRYWVYDEINDEPNLNFVQFVCVYDDTAARERYDTTQWRGAGNEDTRRADLTEYISESADIISFNWYSGVVAR